MIQRRLLLLLTALTISAAAATVGVSAAAAGSAPSKPVVAGPRTTTSTKPVYRFSSKAPGVAATRILFLCSIDSKQLRSCPARFQPSLGVGKHLLRVRAVAPGGVRSALATVSITVRKGSSGGSAGSGTGTGYRGTCTGFPAGGTEMSFPSNDGATLYGIRFGSGSAGIALAPQSGGNICDWAPAVQAIVARGVQVLVYEPGTGFARYSTPAPSGALLEVEEAAAATALRNAGVGTIFVGGSSAGAGAALDSVELLSPRPRGVVFFAGASSDARLDIVRRETGLAFLYVTAAGDGSVAAANSEALYSATASADKQLIVYPGLGDHGVALFGSSVGDQLKATLGDWLAARAS
jgi:hypothetical protein